MSIQKKAEKVLAKAKKAAGNSNSWADFSIELFDQQTGLVARTFRDEMERQAFFDSPQYQEINKLLANLMKKTGIVNGATPAREKSGRFNVRIPKTLHRSLEIEAKDEGVSLNQLALCKLALPLRHAADVDLRLLIQAFADIHDGFAIDRIVVDPDYNAKFLRRCRELGMDQGDFRLNHTLLNVRKNRKSRERLGIDIPATTQKTEFHDFDEYQFASEIAVRVLQRTEGVSLDRILCDPPLGKRFDEIALQFANQTVLKLRWAALNLRKTHRLRPMENNANEHDLVSVGPLNSIDLADLTDNPGLYAVYETTRPIFAGETKNLRNRIQLHLKYGMPCVDIAEDEHLTLKTVELPKSKQADRVRLVTDFVNREHPLLNYQRVA